MRTSLSPSAEGLSVETQYYRSSNVFDPHLSLSYIPTDTLYRESQSTIHVNLLTAKGAEVFVREAPPTEDLTCLTDLGLY